jgi:hypothetical protein
LVISGRRYFENDVRRPAGGQRRQRDLLFRRVVRRRCFIDGVIDDAICSCRDG